MITILLRRVHHRYCQASCYLSDTGQLDSDLNRQIWHIIANTSFDLSGHAWSMVIVFCLQCFDAVGWEARRASGL